MATRQTRLDAYLVAPKLIKLVEQMLPAAEELRAVLEEESYNDRDGYITYAWQLATEIVAKLEELRETLTEYLRA